MARMEFRKPINDLLEEKRKCQQQLTASADAFNLRAEELGKLRADERAYRESLEALPKSASHTPARNVFNRQLAEVRGRIQEVDKELDKLNKEKEMWQSKINSIDTSIRELSR